MNTFERAYKNSHKEPNKIKKWWSKNKYTANKIILFPIWIITVIKDKYDKNRFHRCKWTKEKAIQFWNYYLPKWVEPIEDNNFWYFNNGTGFCKKSLKRKDRYFARMYKSDLLRFLKTEYKMIDYTIEDISEDSGWCEIILSKKGK